MNKIRTALACIGILWTLNSYSQQFIPMGTLPMLYNGGFAGESERGRLNAGIGIRTASMLSDLDYAVSYYGSYDQFITKPGLGVGLTFSQDHSKYDSDTAVYSKTRNYLLLSISPKLSFRGKYTLAPFVDVGFLSAQGNADEIPFRNIPMGNSLSVRTGFLFNSKKFYAGFTYYIFNTNHRAVLYPYYTSGMVERYSYVVQLGYTFQRHPESKFSFTPQVAYLHFNGPFGYDLNFMFRYKKIILSINNNGLGLGMQSKKFRFLVSQTYLFFRNGVGSITVRYMLK